MRVSASLCLVLSGLALTAAWWSSSDLSPARAVSQPATEDVAPEQCLPRHSDMLLRFDGAAAHFPALKETAKWEALDETGLRDRVFDVLEMAADAAGPDASALAREMLEQLHLNGFSSGISLGENGAISPWGVIVAHGVGDKKDEILELLFRIDPAIREAVETQSKQDREISVAVPPNAPVPGLEFAVWTEGDHLVLAGGVNAVDRTLAAVTGKTPNVTEHRLWKSLRGEKEFTVNELAWIDVQSILKSTSAFPIPPLSANGPSVTVGEFAELLGLQNLQSLTVSSGYKEAATWERMRIDAPQPHTGLLALLNQRNITLDELPPLPADTDGFFAAAFDIRGAVDTLLEATRTVLDGVAPDEVDEFDQMIDEVTSMIGDPRDVLASGFGDVFCVYSDPTAMPFTFGLAPVVAVSVQDRSAVEQSLFDLIDSIPPQALDGATIDHKERDGVSWFSFAIPDVPFVPSLLVTDKWAVMSLTPGSGQSLTKRTEGKIKSWKPGPEHESAFAQMPKEFSSVSMLDPRPGYQQLISFLPMGHGLIQTMVLPELSRETGMNLEMPFDVSDLPVPAEVTEAMFPNVAVGRTMATGCEVLSRNSVPSNPLGSVGSTATIPILAALILPAVQQAREAARRTQSKNNLKQIGLAMHNYHDVNGRFPPGTVENEDLKPEKRLGWAAEILPYLEQSNLYDRIEMDKSWEDQDEFLSDVVIPAYQNPSNPKVGRGGQLHYMGFAGLGEDAATLEIDHPDAGIFGYDRVTEIRDITDGTSNTFMVGDAREPIGSYLNGYMAIRGLTEEPYVNGPDGFGSFHAGGMQILFADGSVRFISENIDGQTMEALTTIAGGEVIGGF